MTLQTSGAISLNDLKTEFGGPADPALGDYYAGGSYVPSGTSGTNGAVPTSGAISLWNFYGTANIVDTGWLSPTFQSAGSSDGNTTGSTNVWDNNFGTGWSWSYGVFAAGSSSTIAVGPAINCSEVLEWGQRIKISNGYQYGTTMMTYQANNGTRPPDSSSVSFGYGLTSGGAVNTSYFTPDDTSYPTATDPHTSLIYGGGPSYAYQEYAFYNANTSYTDSANMRAWLAGGPRFYGSQGDTNGSTGGTLWEMIYRCKYVPS